MVATESEIQDIVDVMLAYFTDKSMLLNMMEEVWVDVGVVTDNVSLRETILGLKMEIEERD
jgi:hypothetical protein|tara:strand:- start:226 stop:408 length:183 start_codon:yes stop_codon:yes gene_type:complete